ncbi:MAG TPA: hypothetical protein PLM24_04600 [Methanothrix sp.]|nr:hypothetical protein [Methanothrix sp.]HPJ83954.1 hypothetical protein [Methanothrix sp.]HPR66397.1 hypothetical protein [Methanothrix sp.]
MKTEANGTISGPKVAGVLALLASLLLLLLVPAASADETYSLILLANVDPVLASDGETVTFTFDVDNTGTGTLYDVVVMYFAMSEEIYIGDLEGGASVYPTADYVVNMDDALYKRGRPYIYNSACVMGYDEYGTLLARANAGCSIIVI